MWQHFPDFSRRGNLSVPLPQECLHGLVLEISGIFTMIELKKKSETEI